MNKREFDFVKVLEQQNKTFLFEPKRFYLPAPLNSYCPDFYVIEDNAFYEVVGSPQAFAQNKPKYEAFRKNYPKLKLLIVHPSGEPYEESKSVYQKQTYNKNKVCESSILFEPYTPLNIKQIMGKNLRRIRRSKNMIQETLGLHIESSASHIAQMEGGRGIGSETLAKLCNVLGVRPADFFHEELYEDANR